MAVMRYWIDVPDQVAFDRRRSQNTVAPLPTGRTCPPGVMCLDSGSRPVGLESRPAERCTSWDQTSVSRLAEVSSLGACEFVQMKPSSTEGLVVDLMHLRVHLVVKIGAYTYHSSRSKLLPASARRLERHHRTDELEVRSLRAGPVPGCGMVDFGDHEMNHNTDAWVMIQPPCSSTEHY